MPSLDRSTKCRWILAAVLTLARPVGAQCADSSHASPSHAASVVYLQSDEADRMRIRNDLGECHASASLIRSALSLAPVDSPRPPRLELRAVAPLLQATSNSRLPQSFNDGAMWAGRGLTVALTGGVRADYRRVTVVIAPELTTAANRASATLPSPAGDRSSLASPWHVGPQSIDMPQRFGDASYSQLTPGQSTIEVALSKVAVGASTENLWWGPAVQNALVMSDNAQGIPQIYVRTPKPIATSIGRVEGRILLGTLTESRFFDTVSTNNLRSFSAGAISLRPNVDTGLTVGIARAVYKPIGGMGELWGHVADLLWRWPTRGFSAKGVDQSEQVTSLFGRWVFPESGFEVYGEWAKLLFPPTLRDALVAPQRNQGYTAGLQWAHRLTGPNRLRLQSELTMLEHTPASLGAPTVSFYLSGAAPQGYTQRGQVIGAAIGPGSSTQWVAADVLHPHWSAGLTLGRIRWDDDAYLDQAVAFSSWTHDVSIYAGLRGSFSSTFGEATAQLTTADRLNYLFQTSSFGFGSSSAFDIHNLNVRLTFIPRM